jgi:hypothetical protein
MDHILCSFGLLARLCTGDKHNSCGPGSYGTKGVNKVSCNSRNKLALACTSWTNRASQAGSQIRPQ